MSHRSTHSPTCGFQAVLHNTQRTHELQRNQKTKIRNARTRKKCNERNQFYPCGRCVFCVCALRTLLFFNLHRMTSVCCVHCVAYGSLETDLRFRRSTCGFQVVIGNICNATDARLAAQSKKKRKYAIHARPKQNGRNRLYSLHACIACIALRTTAWKRRPLSPILPQKCGKNSDFALMYWLKHRITRKLLKIDRYMLRGVGQALNCLPSMQHIVW